MKLELLPHQFEVLKLINEAKKNGKRLFIQRPQLIGKPFYKRLLAQAQIEELPND